MSSHLLYILWLAVPSLSYINEPCTVTDVCDIVPFNLSKLTRSKLMTMVDHRGNCQQTGASSHGDGGCPEGASVPGGFLKGGRPYR